MGQKYYCAKCGNINTDEQQCLGCLETKYIKLIPEKYISYIAGTIPMLNKDLKEEFIENVIKTSPDFDQSAWDRRIHWEEYDDNLNNKIKQEQANQPKCPTCGSTNVQKITGLERGISVATLGLFSKKINKSFKCNHCGYTW